MEPWHLLIAAVVVLLAIAVTVIVLGMMADERRARRLARFAEMIGLRFSQVDPFHLVDRLRGCRFSLGSGFEASNIIHGSYRGRDILAFDYLYVGGRGRRYRFSACRCPLDALLPNLLVRPASFGENSPEIFGEAEIDFESDEFSRRYIVRSLDRKFAYDVCHPRTIELVMAHPQLTVMLVDGALVVYDGRRWSPERFRAAMDFSVDFLALVPRFVWQEHAERAGR